jgi:hypothetical protein
VRQTLRATMTVTFLRPSLWREERRYKPKAV